jgi:hypothetical protein
MMGRAAGRLGVLAPPPQYSSSNTIVNPPSTQEAIMEIGIALGALVSVFVGLAALILWFPYDRYNK